MTTIPVKTYTYKDIVKNINFPSFFNNFNPSMFEYKGKLYTTHRIHFIPNIMYHREYKNKSHIAISREDNSVIYLNIPDIYDKIVPTIFGYEDARSFVINDNLYLLCVVFYNSSVNSQMCLIKIPLKEINIEKDNIIHVDRKNIILINPSLNETSRQKNWMPFVKNNELYLIYSLNPLTIYNCNVNNGRINLFYKESINTNIPLNLRGSSNILSYFSKRFNTTIKLCISHIKYVNSIKIPFFTNVFVAIKDKILAISDEFIINEKNIKFINPSFHNIYRIDFVSSIYIKDNILYVLYGKFNTESKRFEISIEEMEKTLKLV